MKKIKVILGILIIVLAFSACGSKKKIEEKVEEKQEVKITEEIPKEEVEQEIEKQEEIKEVEKQEVKGPISELTGLEITKQEYDRRPIAVMIGNTKGSLPQFGISQADILYETLVEGGRTRLMGVFQDFDAKKIGSIRSCRHYFLDFALDNDAVYTHVGQSTKAIKAFKKLDVDRMYGISKYDLMLTFQDKQRKRPHSTFTSFEKLLDTLEEMGYRKEANYENKLFEFNEEDTLIEGSDAKNIALKYSYYITAGFEYDEESKVYLKSQFGKPHMDAASNEQLKFKNIIVQFTKIWLIKGDPLGLMDMDLIGSGDGLYISNGKVQEITWEKDNHYSGTKFYKGDGTRLKLNAGKTFISVFPKNKKEDINID